MMEIGMDILQLIHWDTVITGLMSASIIWLIKRGERKRDAAREEAEANRMAEASWRADVDRLLAKQGGSLDDFSDERSMWEAWRSEMLRRLDDQDEKIDLIVVAQATTMRSDIIHKCHRYLDDLGCASVDEKQALDTQYKEYERFCAKNGIENHFVEDLVKQISHLPNRARKSQA
jgi:hypothetical protein